MGGARKFSWWRGEGVSGLKLPSRSSIMHTLALFFTWLHSSKRIDLQQHVTP